MVLSCIASKLSQLAQCMVGSIQGRWSRNPHYFFADFYVLFSLVFGRLKYIPISNKVHMVFPCDKDAKKAWCNFHWEQSIKEKGESILDPTSPEVVRVLPVLVKIVQALSDGLRLQSDCKVSARVPKGYDRMLKKDDLERVVVSRFAQERGSADDLQIVSSNNMATKQLGLKYNTEHLDGLNWELMVVDSEDYNAYYYGNGKILLNTSMLYSFRSEKELAEVLAHEVGHGVAMHTFDDDYPIALWLYFLIPLPSSFWFPALLRSLDLVLYCLRRMELEADYIGLMLMACAGYDPRQAGEFYKKLDSVWYLDTTHPSGEKRAQALRRAGAMDRAVKIYEQVQAGHGVPSFV